jgi:hypothetical protein
MKLIDYVSLYPSISAVIVGLLAAYITVIPPTTMKVKIWLSVVFVFFAVSAIIAMIWQVKLGKEAQKAEANATAIKKAHLDSVLTSNILAGINKQLAPLKVRFNDRGKLINSNNSSVQTGERILTKLNATKILLQINKFRADSGVTNKRILYSISEESNLRTFSYQLTTLLRKDGFMIDGPDTYYASQSGITMDVVNFLPHVKVIRIIVGTTFKKGDVLIHIQ